MFTGVNACTTLAGWQTIPSVDHLLTEKDMQSGPHFNQLSVVTSQGIRIGC